MAMIDHIDSDAGSKVEQCDKSKAFLVSSCHLKGIFFQRQLPCGVHTEGCNRSAKAIPVTPSRTSRPAARASLRSRRAKASNVACAKRPRHLSIEPWRRKSWGQALEGSILGGSADAVNS